MPISAESSYISLELLLFYLSGSFGFEALGYVRIAVPVGDGGEVGADEALHAVVAPGEPQVVPGHLPVHRLLPAQRVQLLLYDDLIVEPVHRLVRATTSTLGTKRREGLERSSLRLKSYNLAKKAVSKTYLRIN